MDPMKIQLHQTSASTTEADIRHHKILIDRPASKGGHDRGPMGGELFLASIGGCFMSNLLAAIKARQADVSDVQLEVTATLLDAPARFSAVELSVSATFRGKLDLTVRITTPV
jgi:putative redox protein